VIGIGRVRLDNHWWLTDLETVLGAWIQENLLGLGTGIHRGLWGEGHGVRVLFTRNGKVLLHSDICH